MNSKRWYIENGNQGDVVLSTRIRLARNLENFPFPGKLDLAGKKQVNEEIKDTVLGCCEGFQYIEMSSLTRTQAYALAERHLISPEFASSGDGKALLLTEDESVSVMLCEEDHIRLQVLCAGLALEEAYDIADKLDGAIGQRMQYAYDERIGYLTQCPTNLGTAMRASVMLHLPALTRTGRLSRLASTVSKLGLTIRGAYGEGSAAKGDIYQLSNQITLGISEKAALDNLQAIALQIVNQERSVSSELMKNPEFEDKIFRAYGILTNARLLSCDEFIELASLVRLGITKGLIQNDICTINELLTSVQPNALSAAQDAPLSPDARDVLRAKLVREKLAAK